jgi:hypothetical protein
MKTKTIDRLLNFAKGEKAPLPSIFLIIERNKAGEVIVKGANIVDNQTQDIIFQSCLNGGTTEFWNNYDLTAIIEEVRQNLINGK